MDFAWTAEHEAFRTKVRDFLAAHLPQDWPGASGNFDAGGYYTTDFARDFCPKLAAAGLLVPHWPKEYGGQGADAWHHWILNEEMFEAGEPRSYQYMSVNWAGPALIKFGTEAQKAEHLPRIAEGKLFYCQGFSEPNAGSDLASLRTSAKLENGRYRINGQKIWTSAASFADYCIVLARTGEGRKAITVLILPMDRPGIQVNVIKGFQGARAFHEVFFDEVEAGPEDILGEVGTGWDVVQAVMHNERVGAPRYTLTIRGLEEAVALLQAQGRFSDSAVRTRAARARVACEAARLQAYQIIDGRVKGLPPTAATSTTRYSMVMADKMVADFLGDYLGDELIRNVSPAMSAAYRRTGSTGVASGTAEVQLNLIARNMLGLPKE
ncbi:acyl-CoA dehydrogenase [Frigidibacter albus]|uniref:Acyl-CoA dehydrogenase n=1 Tax=Frigidibacter albus TaxID=1465486 RepID=A0A6L8VLH4_9RHOB|nr:acyl-CoA dehydrogenase family protein [Frigidibacter albus]MZQ91063.1 acyl-CoA dehydrogenase [Frigidibacter albus]NBE32948.1 acyl-CoA dehydrogenase [Frigidibacter albus]GGH62584.1 acyl-CoA dehydrogenase [Frigidibacter albus]